MRHESTVVGTTRCVARVGTAVGTKIATQRGERFVTDPDGGHGFEREMADQPVVQDALARVLAFLGHHLAATSQATAR